MIASYWSEVGHIAAFIGLLVMVAIAFIYIGLICVTFVVFDIEDEIGRFLGGIVLIVLGIFLAPLWARLFEWLWKIVEY